MNSDVQNIYCMDASAFITMHRYYPKSLMPDLWDLLTELFNKKRLFSHRIVFDEIVPKSGEHDPLAKWIIPFEKSFRPITQRQMELMPDILSNFPKLINPANEKDEADPYLVAMLLEIMEQNSMFDASSDYILVSTESERSAVKLPAACRYYNIRHVNLLQFFDANGLQFTISRGE